MKKLDQQIVSAHGNSGQKWLHELPFLVKSLAEKWQLSSLIEYENLSWNYVSKGLRFDREVVLKISYDLLSLEKEVNALRVFPSGSCVEVIEFEKDLKAVLLEAAIPGTALMSTKFEDPFKPLEICCEISQKMRINQKPCAFPYENFNNLFQTLEKDWDIPDPFLQTARRFKKELYPVKEEASIIHGDLHRENILSHQGEWTVIDPKGYLGTLYNEVWPFIHEPKNEIPWVAKKLHLDETRLMKWCFIHSILATAWCIEDSVDPKNIFGLAKKIFPLLC